MSSSEELELLLLEAPRLDLGGADNITCFGVFGLDSGGAAAWGGGGCGGSCWNSGIYAMSRSEGGQSAGLESS